jgi:hypothetical protein
MLPLILAGMLFTSGQGFSDPKPYSPNDTVLFALADAQATQNAKHYRYLSLANVPAEKRARFTQVTNFVVNSLSRRQSMVFCTTVVGSNGSVVRLNLSEYRIDPAAWDTLASKGSGPVRVATKEDQPEPYYTFNLGGTKTRKVQRKDKQGNLLYMNGDTSQPVYDEVAGGLAPGTWFDIVGFKALQAATGTDYPILRADWFIANSSLNPGYSEMLGIKTLEDFNKLVRYRTEDDDLSGRAVVADSQLVSLHQRGIEFTPKVNGTYWQTYDFFKSSGLNDLLKDPLKRKRDAGEVFAELPNGLQAFTLVDENNKIIDFADGNIVSDQVSPWKNKLVWNGLFSCTHCHKNGAQDVLDEVRPLTAPPRGLVTKNQKGFDDFVDKYTKNVEAELANTRSRYALAVATATKGLKPEENTAAFTQIFIDYQQKPLRMSDAASEVGCTPAQLSAILGRIIEPDPAVTTLLAGRPLRRDLWEAAFAQVATAVYKTETKK